MMFYRTHFFSQRIIEAVCMAKRRGQKREASVSKLIAKKIQEA